MRILMVWVNKWVFEGLEKKWSAMVNDAVGEGEGLEFGGGWRGGAGSCERKYMYSHFCFY